MADGHQACAWIVCRAGMVFGARFIMGNKRINIAYYTADWNRELVSVALHTVKKYLEQHPDVSVQVFDCFSFALYSGRSESGYQIYDLPDMGRYDAVIVQAHQIMDTDAIRRLEERIIETGVPAMSIGATMKGCISIGTDDYSAAREMTERSVTKVLTSRVKPCLTLTSALSVASFIAYSKQYSGLVPDPHQRTYFRSGICPPYKKSGREPGRV